jgi:sugar phosphate isomerase/epimerase
MSNPFKLGILAGDAGDRPPEKIAPGYDTAEIPNSLQMRPLESQATWIAHKQEIDAWHLPKVTASSHWFGRGMAASGPGIDQELIDFWIGRSFSRLAELGVKYVGCYGSHFPVPEGFSRTKATDQALAHVSKMADEADKYGMMIALEPMAAADSVFPRYLDGLAFAQQINRPSVRIMADLAYFIKINQPLTDIEQSPEYCVNVHLAGHQGQPGVGDMVDIHTRLFQILKGVGYELSVTSACPWISTVGGEMDFARETAKSLAYLQGLRDKVYAA